MDASSWTWSTAATAPFIINRPDFRNRSLTLTFTLYVCSTRPHDNQTTNSNYCPNGWRWYKLAIVCPTTPTPITFSLSDISLSLLKDLQTLNSNSFPSSSSSQFPSDNLSLSHNSSFHIRSIVVALYKFRFKTNSLSAVIIIIINSLLFVIYEHKSELRINENDRNLKRNGYWANKK